MLSTAERLASEAKSLLDVLNTIKLLEPLDRFQFELRTIDTQDEQCIRYKMLLRIAPLVWFKCHELNNAETLEICMRKPLSIRRKSRKKQNNFDGSRTKTTLYWHPALTYYLIDVGRSESYGGVCPRKTDTKNPCPHQHYQWCIDETQGKSGFCYSGWIGHIMGATCIARQWLKIWRLSTNVGTKL